MAGERTVYTHGNHESVMRSHRQRTAANSAAYLTGWLAPGMSLLDVGCGPGTITADLAGLVAPGPVTAVDAAAGSLAEARQTAARRGLANVTFAVADVHALGYGDATFDVVHAHQVLQHVTDPVLALREMRRVCRPGGIAAARDADYEAMTWYPAVPALDEWLALYRRVARANGGEPDAGRRLHAWARQAGFSKVTCTASAWSFASPEERAHWGGTWSERIVKSTVAEQILARGLATAGDLERLADGWREWAGAEDGWFGILHAEILCRP
jgi:ubiquinone/menaquinone biosynthesis C-methylase UbiE